MDNDDIMLNIVTGTSKLQTTRQIEQPTKKISKTDVKRMKYSMKMKLNTSRSKHQARQSGSQENSQSTLFTKSFMKTAPKKKTDANENEPKKQNGIKIEEQAPVHQKQSHSNNLPRKINLKSQRNGRKQHTSADRKGIKDERKQLKSGKNSQFKPQLRKDVIVTELMPEVQSLANHIDKNDLDFFKLEPKLKDSLIRQGVTKLTQIQSKTYEPLLNGADSVIKASTGSGKTLSYLIPLVNRILIHKTITKREDGTCILIVCPTRELCVQGQRQANRCLKRCPFIISGCLYGGEETNHEKSRLRKGTNILFCTPGRVLYHLEQTKSFKLDNIKALVFEEADRTLDMGFQDAIHKILSILGGKISLSSTHKILVSAHFNSKVSSLLQQLEMNNPQFIGFQNIGSDMKLSKLKESKDMEINTSTQLKQQYVLMSEQQKIPLMLAYLGVLKDCKALIFVSTIDEVQYFDYLLNNLRFRDSNGNDTDIKFEKRPIFKIHGDLDQKLRSKTYLEFRQSKEAILISTEVASRGLDFPDLSHIILFDVPPTITDYGNRVGRSARFNQTGVSLLMLHYLQSDYAQKIRYYAPNLQLIEKDIIYESFEKILKSMNIGDQCLHYVEGLVRASVKSDNQKYTVARKAYVSMLRAYARMPDRQIFAVKKLNLKLLARSFGLNNAQAGSSYNPKAKSSHLQASRKKRKVEDVKKLQFSQYM